MKVLAFLKNKYVLYTLIFLGVLNVLGYVALEDYNSTALFIVVILLSNYFSSNQSLNILVAILVTSLVAINHRFREGFKEKGFDTGSVGLKGKKVERQNDPVDIIAKGETSASVQPKEVAIQKSSIPDVLDITQSSVRKLTQEEKQQAADAAAARAAKEKEQEEEPKAEEEEAAKGSAKGETCKVDADCSSKNCIQGKKGATCGFRNNVPSSSPASVNSDEPGVEMDVAAKMEDAYNNLNKMMGDGSMKSMASETKKLVAQQKDLMTTLHSMTPALNSAKETLKNLNLPNMDQMTNLLKKFNQ